MVSISEARAILNPKFPKLTDHNFSITSPCDPTYNCIAWAAGDQIKWWWPGSQAAFWPVRDQSLSIVAFREVFSQLGYVQTTSHDNADRFERIVIYTKDGIPTHAARQTADGAWTSKLGQAWDIAHKFDALNDGEYGLPTLIMERSR